MRRRQLLIAGGIALVLFAGWRLLSADVRLMPQADRVTGEKRDYSPVDASAPALTYSEILAATLRSAAQRPEDMARFVGNSPDIFKAALAARASNDPDLIRLAAEALSECVGLKNQGGASLAVAPNAKADPETVKLQKAAVQALNSQCAGVMALSSVEAIKLRDDMRRQAEGAKTLLGQLDRIAQKTAEAPLSAEDKANVIAALRSGDQVLASKSLYILGPMLADSAFPPDQRPDFWYTALLAAAVQQTLGTQALQPVTDLQLNEACFFAAACRGADGAMRNLDKERVPSTEMMRIQNAYATAIKSGGFDQIIAVR